jgi:cupin 2 domain-containing protein
VMELKPGDFVNIPAHKKHRVEWATPNEPAIWLAVFYKD